MKTGKKPAPLPCHCGGTLRYGHLSNFDFSSFVGVPVRLTSVPGYTCDQCGAHTLEGALINDLERVLALVITQKPWLVSSQEARFMRRHLGLTQDKLAERLGVARETVARWETGSERISPHHDLNLRTVVIASFGANGPKVLKPFPTTVLNEALQTLTSVRKEGPEPGKELDPCLVQTLLDKLRPSSGHRGSSHYRR
jgi:DNA-binding transcriptional regulator YiaG